MAGTREDPGAAIAGIREEPEAAMAGTREEPEAVMAGAGVGAWEPRRGVEGSLMVRSRNGDSEANETELVSGQRRGRGRGGGGFKDFGIVAKNVMEMVGIWWRW